MIISAGIRSDENNLETSVSTNGSFKAVSLPSKPSGNGSAVNGGELLLLSLATCFCNDLYREAQKRNIKIKSIAVNVTCDFGAEGEAGSNFKYHTDVIADATDGEIQELIRHTDSVAEIHNTLRKGVSVELTN